MTGAGERRALRAVNGALARRGARRREPDRLTPLECLAVILVLALALLPFVAG